MHDIKESMHRTKTSYGIDSTCLCLRLESECEQPLRKYIQIEFFYYDLLNGSVNHHSYYTICRLINVLPLV